MADDVNVKITADNAELGSKLDQAGSKITDAANRWREALAKMAGGTKTSMTDASSSVRDGTKAIGGHFESLSAPVSTVTKLFGAVAAALAGGAIFREGIEATKQFTGEAVKLGKQLGITATEASTLNVALGDVFSDAETYGAAAGMLARQVRQNEDALNAMGLKTRDAAGNYRNMNELMLDSIKVINSYKEGTDRNLAAMTAWGRGASEAAGLLKLNNAVLEEAKEKQEALGLTVGVENVQALKAYKAAMNDSGDVMLAVKKVIGDAVMPVLTKLSEWFNLIGPAAVTTIKFALGGLVGVFWALKNGIVVVWETLNAMVVTIAEPIIGLVTAISRAMRGDFAGAAEAVKASAKTISGAWTKAMDEMMKSSVEADEQVRRLFGGATPIAATASGGKAYQKYEKPTDGKDAPSGYMAYYEYALEEEKRFFAQRQPLLDYGKEQERDFWATLLRDAEVTSKDRLEILRKIARLETDIMRDEAKKMRAVDEERVAGKLKAGEDAIELARMEARAQVELGNMTQGELLAQEREWENRRADMRRSFLEWQRGNVDPMRDPVAYERITQQIEALEREHLARMRAISLEETALATAPVRGMIDSMRSGFESLFAGIGTRIKTMGQLLQGLWQAVAQAVMSSLGKIAADWVVKNIVIKAMSKVMTIGQIGENAAKAGSGGVASMAAAPFPMNLSAPAFGAAMAGLALSFAPLASAAQGWDIPAGINPITQLHQKEMVLPAEQADAIRSMAASGAAVAAAPIVLQGYRHGNFFISELGALQKALDLASRRFMGK